MSATADVHQYLAVNIPDRQQLSARVGVRLAFQPDWLNRASPDRAATAMRSSQLLKVMHVLSVMEKCLFLTGVGDGPFSHQTEPRLQPGLQQVQLEKTPDVFNRLK